MAQDIKLSMDGMLLNWLKSAGDSVKAGEIIAEFEADKATVEVEAPSDGVLVELKAEVGEQYNEGTVIAVLGAAGETSAPASKSKPDEKAEEKAVKAEDKAEDKAAPTNGAASQGEASQGEASKTEDGRIKASPLAKRVAAEKGVDLEQVAGSGPGGRIIRADVEGFEPSQAPARTPAASAAPAEGGAQSYGKLPEGPDVEVEDMSRMRRAIARGTITSVQTTPHFYVLMECGVDALLEMRKQLNDSLEEEGIRISVNDMIVKAAALALRKFPNLNSHYYGDKIVRHKRINVAIAVALPNNGLVNVVSPDADKVALSELARYHKHLFDEVRNGKIKTDYIQGGTFLVSNLGAYDVESFSSIIDPPQAGALAVGAARKVPVVMEDGSIGIETRMKVNLSVDHRVSDGAEGAQWLALFRQLIENPLRLLA